MFPLIDALLPLVSQIVKLSKRMVSSVNEMLSLKVKGTPRKSTLMRPPSMWAVPDREGCATVPPTSKSPLSCPAKAEANEFSTGAMVPSSNPPNDTPKSKAPSLTPCDRSM